MFIVKRVSAVRPFSVTELAYHLPNLSKFLETTRNPGNMKIGIFLYIVFKILEKNYENSAEDTPVWHHAPNYNRLNLHQFVEKLV